jgi:hypothetical protein
MHLELFQTEQSYQTRHGSSHCMAVQAPHICKHTAAVHQAYCQALFLQEHIAPSSSLHTMASYVIDYRHRRRVATFYALCLLAAAAFFTLRVLVRVQGLLK